MAQAAMADARVMDMGALGGTDLREQARCPWKNRGACRIQPETHAEYPDGLLNL